MRDGHELAHRLFTTTMTKSKAPGDMCLLRLPHGAVRDVDGGAVVAEAGVAVRDEVLHRRGRRGQVREGGVRSLDACVVEWWWMLGKGRRELRWMSVV